MANIINNISYIEFPLVESAATKQFYAQVFGWEFTDWGPNYMSFAGAGVDGGFNGVDGAQIAAPGVLVVLYADDLPQKLKEVEAAGGEVVKPIYSFPGGKRFHFLDPNGTELAVWSV
jgi:predicted enzyme related to lactoylglutathione lyase